MAEPQSKDQPVDTVVQAREITLNLNKLSIEKTWDIIATNPDVIEEKRQRANTLPQSPDWLWFAWI